MFGRIKRWFKGLFKKEVVVREKPDRLFNGNESRQERLTRLYSSMKKEAMGRQKLFTISWYTNKAKEGRPKYEQVADEIGCPWEIVACVHALEASFSWSKNLMNGQDYKKRTTWVPKGYGPWDSWEEAAIDAFLLKRKQGKLPEEWSIGSSLEFLLLFNGSGYERRGLVSAYLWSFSNHYVNQGGSKFVSDGQFDRNAVSLQVGAAIILKELGFSGGV